MSRANNEAETGRPTVEQEMAAFKGFSTNDGDTITPEKPEDLNPVTGKNMSAAEIEAAKGKEVATTKTVAKPAEKEPPKLSDEEKDKVIQELDKKLGREATDEEVAKAVADAANTKNGSGKTKAEQKSSDRYRAMQRRDTYRLLIGRNKLRVFVPRSHNCRSIERLHSPASRLRAALAKPVAKASASRSACVLLFSLRASPMKYS